MKKKKNYQGFTIIEMLIVVAVTGILLSTIGFAIITFQRNFGEKTAKHEAALYLEQLIKMIQLEFPGANTVPFIDSATLNYAPLTQNDNTVRPEFFGNTHNIFVAQYDDVFDVNANYDTTKYLFISHYDAGSGSLTDPSDLGVRVLNLNVYDTTLDVVAATSRMNFIAHAMKPTHTILEEAIVTNEDNRWYLIGFFFRVRSYWYKDKSIEDAAGKRNPYNFDLTLNTNLKIRN